MDLKCIFVDTNLRLSEIKILFIYKMKIGMQQKIYEKSSTRINTMYRN